MGTYDELAIGDTFTTPERTLTEDDVQALVAVGGYTHPLFTDPAFAAASPFGKRPIPGEGVLHMMGGLIESSDRFDETVVALVGFDEVAFKGAAFAGDTIRVQCETLEKVPGRSTGLIAFAWRCLNASDEVLVEARARMLFRLG